MAGPRRDTRGIVEAQELFARVHFRRREPAPALRPYLEHYWLIDWDLTQPYATHVVPHPSVNVVLQQYGDEAAEMHAREELLGFDDAPGVASRTCHVGDPMSRLFNT
ncbi:DUF6597 domain-containing transcriptional factor, partial [Streptomyces lunaelactis]|uniref:DUF6597 domain-containing transcriptional factor n=1 Tax=Streptomyces lunaelactis TaxID=1535768 RepID=UPI0035A0E208